MREGRFPPGRLAKYPRLGSEESLIADRWWARGVDGVLSVDYDYRVGTGVVSPADLPEWVKLDAHLLSQPRIDAVCYLLGEVWLVEFKPRQSMSGLGQLIVYSNLFPSSDLAGRSLVLKLVCGRLVNDLEPAYGAAGVEVILV